MPALATITKTCCSKRLVRHLSTTLLCYFNSIEMCFFFLSFLFRLFSFCILSPLSFDNSFRVNSIFYLTSLSLSFLVNCNLIKTIRNVDNTWINNEIDWLWNECNENRFEVCCHHEITWKVIFIFQLNKNSFIFIQSGLCIRSISYFNSLFPILYE